MPKTIRYFLWKTNYILSFQSRKLNIDIPRNFSSANVYVSLVALNHPHVQRPQHLAIASALDAGSLTIFVHVNSSSNAEIFNFEGNSGKFHQILKINLKQWKRLSREFHKQNLKYRIFLPAHTNHLKKSWIGKSLSKSKNSLVIMDLFDLMHPEIDGVKISKHRMKYQNYLERNDHVLWLACSDHLFNLINAPAERKLLSPNAHPSQEIISIYEQLLEHTNTKTFDNILDFISSARLNGKYIFLFSGSFGDWIEEELIQELISRFPDEYFLIFGPGYLKKTPEFVGSNVLQLENIGYLEYWNLLSLVDFGLAPFDSSEISNAASPLKIYEYLYHGLLVLCSNPNHLVSGNTIFWTDFMSTQTSITHLKLPLKTGIGSINETWKIRKLEIDEFIAKFIK